MKIAILADIHANSEALKEVLDEVKSLRVEVLIIAGDFVGYYYNARGVMSLLEDWNVIAIGGNHETMLLQWTEGKNHNRVQKQYGSGIKFAAHDLGDDQVQWLTSLPKSKEFSIDGKTVLLCHGSPWDEDEYLYPDCEQKEKDKLFSLGKDLVVYGHTHYPVIFSSEGQLIVNPGSVGQARDRRPGACWALWDTKSHAVTLKRVDYSVDELIKQCQVNDPEMHYLQTVLTR